MASTVSGTNAGAPRPEKVIAILQSNYIPWKGYFDIIAAVDEFIIFDEVQFTRRDWRNRNKVVVDGQLRWLTIPVKTKGRFEAPINEIEVSEPDWAERHWRILRQGYRTAPFFSHFAGLFESLYAEAAGLRRLTEINELFLRRLAATLELPTAFVRSETVPRAADSATDRLVEICRARQAAVYLSGPAAKAYIAPERFAEAGVTLTYANYSGYRVYDQGLQPFEHGVSIVDLMLRCGPSSRDHLKSLRGREFFLDPA